MAKVKVFVENYDLVPTEEVEVEFPIYLRWEVFTRRNKATHRLQKLVDLRTLHDITIEIEINQNNTPVAGDIKTYKWDSDARNRALFFPTMERDGTEVCTKQDWDWAVSKYKELLNEIQ